MAFPFKSILCPVDFDENSMSALDQAIAIARHHGSTLMVVHVIPLIVVPGEVPPPLSLYEVQEKDAKAKLADIVKNKLGGLKHEEHVYIGDVTQSILATQAKYKPDLIVMATHGRRGLARMFLGSVAEATVRKATCPILTVREEVPTAHGVAKSS